MVVAFFIAFALYVRSIPSKEPAAKITPDMLVNDPGSAEEMLKDTLKSTGEKVDMETDSSETIEL